MKILGVIQARMNSSRLPGKVIMDLNGLPVIWHIYRRLVSCRALDGVIVSIGQENSKPIIKICTKYGMAFHIGPEEDLLKRHLRPLLAGGYDAMARVTADEPLIDPAIVDNMVDMFTWAWPNIDAVYNWLPRTYPDGQDVEIVATNKMTALDRDPSCPREDWLSYLAANRDGLIRSIKNYRQEKDFSMNSLCLDTPEDHRKLTSVLQKIGNDIWCWGTACEAMLALGTPAGA